MEKDLRKIKEKIDRCVVTYEEWDYFWEHHTEWCEIEKEDELALLPPWEQWIHRNLDELESSDDWVGAWTDDGFEPDNSNLSEEQLLFLCQYVAWEVIARDGLEFFLDSPEGTSALEVSRAFELLDYLQSAAALREACESFGEEYPRNEDQRSQAVLQHPGFDNFNDRIVAEIKRLGDSQGYRDRCARYFEKNIQGHRNG